MWGHNNPVLHKICLRDEERGGAFLEFGISISNSKVQIAHSPSNFRLIAQKRSIMDNL